MAAKAETLPQRQGSDLSAHGPEVLLSCRLCIERQFLLNLGHANCVAFFLLIRLENRGFCSNRNRCESLTLERRPGPNEFLRGEEARRYCNVGSEA